VRAMEVSGSDEFATRNGFSRGDTAPPSGRGAADWRRPESGVGAGRLTTKAGQALRTVQVAEVAEHPDNPRDTLGDLTELAASIKTLGLRQPVLVVPVSAFRAAHAVDLPPQASWWCSPVTGAGPRASWPGSLRCRRGCVRT
jgi:hypothetical protein